MRLKLIFLILLIVPLVSAGTWELENGTILEFDYAHTNDLSLIEINSTHYLMTYNGGLEGIVKLKDNIKELTPPSGGGGSSVIIELENLAQEQSDLINEFDLIVEDEQKETIEKINPSSNYQEDKTWRRNLTNIQPITMMFAIIAVGGSIYLINNKNKKNNIKNKSEAEEYETKMMRGENEKENV